MGVTQNLRQCPANKHKFKTRFQADSKPNTYIKATLSSNAAPFNQVVVTMVSDAYSNHLCVALERLKDEKVASVRLSFVVLDIAMLCWK